MTAHNVHRAQKWKDFLQIWQADQAPRRPFHRDERKGTAGMAEGAVKEDNGKLGQTARRSALFSATQSSGMGFGSVEPSCLR
ncbi:MAG: hypothetical protein CVV45_16290 [Spirochaetae bacterium HGW-Spirochaetae-10]|nr:MAG: hypothetical protein CVV45_16290 [Spirochaetae bacterium HGW-Spirochaetae-10]